MVHICGSYGTESKCDRQTDRQTDRRTDGQTEINDPRQTDKPKLITPLFFFEKVGDKKAINELEDCPGTTCRAAVWFNDI